MMTIRLKHKAKGYGCYYMLLEMMLEAKEHRLPVRNDGDYEIIAYELQCETDEVREFIEDCLEVGLFESNEHHVSSPYLDGCIAKVEEISAAGTKAARARWDGDRGKAASGGADVMRMHSDGSASAMQTEQNKEEGEESGSTRVLSGDPDDISKANSGIVKSDAFFASEYIVIGQDYKSELMAKFEYGDAHDLKFLLLSFSKEVGAGKYQPNKASLEAFLKDD